MNATISCGNLEKREERAIQKHIFRRPCKGFNELMRWEMEQYRKEVSALRNRLSASKSPLVTWSEAEQIFCGNGYTLQSQRWRDTYCGSICEHRKDCPLAKLFSPLPDWSAFDASGAGC